MSVAELTVIEGGKKTLRVVEAWRNRERDTWAVADGLVEDVRDAVDEETWAEIEVGGPVNTGLHATLIDVMAEARKEGVDLATKTAAEYFRTSLAWQPAERSAGCSFSVHYRLRAKPNRVAYLQRLVSKFGTVTEDDVARELSESKPKRIVSFLDSIESSVRATIYAKGKPWSHVTQDDRSEIARRLRLIANEIENAEGKFGA